MAKDATSDGHRGSNVETSAPQVSQDELVAFYQAHFSDAAVSQFRETFLRPADGSQAQNGDEYDEDWEEDDLGYYDDGVKRTLTDEQIEIFRHSELRELQRQLEKAAANTKGKPDEDIIIDRARDSEDASSLHAALPSSFRGNGKKKKKGNNRPKPEPKPDLRKRTWDVVDKGVDSLDYD